MSHPIPQEVEEKKQIVVHFTDIEYQMCFTNALDNGWITEVDGTYWYRLGQTLAKGGYPITDIKRWVISRLIMGGGYIERWNYRFLPDRKEYVVYYENTLSAPSSEDNA